MDVKMNLDDAYYLVYKDLTKEDGVLTGRYDAKNGERAYMFGVQTVMELIAYRCGNACGEAFDSKFISNVLLSEARAERGER